MSEEFVEEIISNSQVGDEVITDTEDTNIVQDLDQTTSSNTDNKSDSELDKSSDDTIKIADVKPVDDSNSGDSVEELATKLGWRKDHAGAESVDASTYILRSKDIQKTMRDHNKDLKGQVSSLSGSIDALKDHNERVYNADVKRMQNEITTLKAQKREAVELADVDKVELLDKQIEEVQKDISEPKKAESSNNPVYDEWVADNQWYLTDDDMAKYADTVAEQYQGAPADRLYNLVRAKVAEVFPEKFESVKTDNSTRIDNVKTDDVKPIGPPAPVESGQTKGNSSSFSKADLSQDQLTIMNQFVGTGVMTEEQYINDIAKLQGD